MPSSIVTNDSGAFPEQVFPSIPGHSRANCTNLEHIPVPLNHFQTLKNFPEGKECVPNLTLIVGLVFHLALSLHERQKN